MSLGQRIQQLQQLIKDSEHSFKRESGSVLLLAVSKQQSSHDIEEAFNLGLTQFGENYYQEAEEKIKQLSHLNIIWHFIGPIQSNKTKGIATHFDWVHSINRITIAERLNQYRPSDLPPLNICLQINIIAEPSKSGINCEDAYALAQAVSQLPRLKLRGLMTIPPPQNALEEQGEVFRQLKELLDALNKKLGLSMDTLSMGMSDDIIPAIEAGATIVRIGRALFGERQ